MTPDTLYIDPDRRFAVGYFSEYPEGVCLGVDTSDWEDIEGIHVLRAVFSLDDLCEKIAILDDNLDDVAIERLKYMLSHVVRPGGMRQGRDLCFSDHDRIEPWRDEVEHGRLHFIYRIGKESAMVEAEVPMLWYYDQVYACQIDPRMSLPEGVAPVVDSRMMQCRLDELDSDSFPYYREDAPDERNMIVTRCTLRRTERRSTIRLAGLKHAGGTTIFPPIFESVERAAWGGGYYLTSLNGASGMITPIGGYSDMLHRHLPPQPVIDVAKYGRDLNHWFSDRGMKIYYRDTAKLVPADRDGGLMYHPGGFIRAGLFVDSSSRGGRPASDVRTRFLIISNRGVKLQDIPGIADQNPALLMWDMAVFDFDAVFYIVDEFLYKGVRQVVLLHVPQSLPGIYMDNIAGIGIPGLDRNFAGLWPQGSPACSMEQLSLAARHEFKAVMDEGEVDPLYMNSQWRSRTSALPGLDYDNRLLRLVPDETPENGTVGAMHRLLDAEGALDNIIPDYQLRSRLTSLYNDEADK